MSNYKKIIEKYADEIVNLRDLEKGRAEARAGLIIMNIMDEATREIKEKVGNLYSELLM